MIVKTVGKSCKNGAQIWGLQCSSSSLSSVTILLCDVSCCFPISISVAWSAGHQARVWGGDLCWDIYTYRVSHKPVCIWCFDILSAKTHPKSKNLCLTEKLFMIKPEVASLNQRFCETPCTAEGLYKLSSVSDRSCHEWQSTAYFPLLILQTFSALINLFIVSCLSSVQSSHT